MNTQFPNSANSIEIMKKTVLKSNHKYILSKRKFISSTIIGVSIVFVGPITCALLMSANLAAFIHVAELFGIISVTSGALIFSYGTSAFKPWFFSLGFRVPEEEEIILKYIKIVNSTVILLLFSGFLIFLVSICAMLGEAYKGEIWDIEMVRDWTVAALSGLVFSLFMICLIVLPTKFKLESLLSFEAE